MESGAALKEETFEDLARRVDKISGDVQRLTDDDAKMKAVALKDAVEAFNKLGLTRIVQKLKADERGKQLLFELVDDPAVYALFALHGIVKPDLSPKIVQVLEDVRPFMQSHGGDVEFVKIEGSTVFVRLQGSCNGCSQSAVTLRNNVEEAVKSNFPQITNVEVVPNEPAAPSLVQIAPAGNSQMKGWTKTLAIEDLPPGKMRAFEAAVTNILLVNVDNRLAAYRNECPHQGLPLDGGFLDAESCVLSCPWHGFRFDAANGECLTAPTAQLEVFPLRVQDGFIFVRAT